MQKYSTDIPKAASDFFDGELVVAHYGLGLYFSISETGALIWQGLRHGLSDHEVAAWLASNYADQASEIEAWVPDFIERMREERLIVPVDKARQGPALPPLGGGRLAAPSLERFDDLQELLLLDPVHDVDEQGWPRLADDDAR